MGSQVCLRVSRDRRTTSNKWPRVGVTNKVSSVCQLKCSKVHGHAVPPCFCCDQSDLPDADFWYEVCHWVPVPPPPPSFCYLSKLSSLHETSTTLFIGGKNMNELAAVAFSFVGIQPFSMPGLTSPGALQVSPGAIFAGAPSLFPRLNHIRDDCN